MKYPAIAACLISLSCEPLWADSPLAVEINDFSGGMDSQNLAEKLRANQVRDNQNFRTDFNLGLSRRDGFKNETFGCSSFTAANGLWSFTDPSNNEWLIRLDSAGSLGGANHVGSCLTTAVSTGPLSTASPTDADVGLGKIWFTNRVDGLMSWDGSTFVYYPTAPKASRVAIYRNRVTLSDISNEQSSLRMAGELNGADWNNDARFSTSALSIRVGGVNDGLKIYDFYPGLGEGIIFKANSMYRLLGNDQRDFRVEQITPEIGTIYPNTIAQKGMATLFLSNRGLDAYTPPYNFQPVGQSIQDLLDPLARLTSLSRSLILDSVADWTAGISSPTTAITTFTVVGSIATNNRTFTDTQKTDWALGSVLLSTQVNSSSGSIITFDSVAGMMVYQSTVMPSSIFNQGFENFKDGIQRTGNSFDSTLDWSTFTTPSTVGAGCGWFHTQSITAGLAKDGTSFARVDSNNAVGRIQVKAFVIDQASNVLVSMSVNPTINVGGGPFPYEYFTMNTQLAQGTTGFLGFSSTSTCVATLTQSTFYMQAPIYVSSSVSFWVTYRENGALDSLFLDAISTQIVFNPNEFKASYHSQVFDTRASSPNFDAFRADPSSPGGITFTVETSTASHCCFKNPVPFKVLSGTGATPELNHDRYFIYNASFTVNVPTFTVQISTIIFGSWATGYHRTQAQDVGADITSWGLFTAAQDIGGDGSISYELQSSSWINFGESSWVVTSLNTIPAIPANRYVFARITFGTNASTTTPFVDNITFNWNIGAGNPVPVASTWRDIYYLFYSTSITNITDNDRIAVLNRNNMLDQFNGSTISAVAVHNNTLMMGDASPSGDIYAMDKSTSGFDPNGNVRTSVTLRRLHGEQPDAPKVWDYAYFTLSRADSSASQIFAVDYAINGSTTFYSASNIELSTGTQMESLKSFIPVDQLRQGQFLDIRLRELTQQSIPYTLNRVRVYGTILEVP